MNDWFAVLVGDPPTTKKVVAMFAKESDAVIFAGAFYDMHVIMPLGSLTEDVDISDLKALFEDD